jgi:hypothetical protein
MSHVVLPLQNFPQQQVYLNAEMRICDTALLTLPYTASGLLRKRIAFNEIQVSKMKIAQNTVVVDVFQGDNYVITIQIHYNILLKQVNLHLYCFHRAFLLYKIRYQQMHIHIKHFTSCYTFLPDMFRRLYDIIIRGIIPYVTL